MNGRGRIMLVAGARPNFVKVAALHQALRAVGRPICLVHTGQHYDQSLSQVFFDQLGLPRPDHHLGVGSGSHGLQTGRIMVAFEPVLERERPAAVVVVGDVNSTLACALVAAKAVFPEGRRTTDGRMGPFLPGIGLMAAGLRVPVVPLRIDGLFELKQRRRRLAWPGEVSISFGPPVRYAPGTDAAVITKDLEARVGDLGRGE